MVNYQDLQARCAEFNQTLDDYQMQGRQFITAFATEFVRYLGAPAQAVALCSIDPQKEGLLKYADNFLPIWGENSGEWRFGLRITNQSGSRLIFSFFDFCLRFQQDGVILLHVDASDRREFKHGFADGPEALKPIYDYMVDVLVRSFNRRPWDATAEKSSIGFQVSRDRASGE